ncbi:MAG: hypothetical protein FRX49_08493 [Trebouxia sp. A1-2]|nr:MAG: hypothetical protein FRX49_08493 [Trebouxia sp. A1-2]
MFGEEHAKDNTALGRNLRLGIGWCSKDGNFGDMMIDAFLHFHSVPTTRLYSVAQNIPVGSNGDMYLRGLPADQDAFVLRKKRQAVSDDSTTRNHETKQPAKASSKTKKTQQTGTKDIRTFFVPGQGQEADKATNAGKAAQCTPKRHKAQGEQAKEMPSLKGLCWNVRGLTTVVHELTHLVEQHAPDFVVLTETKLRKKSKYRKKLTEALEDYIVHTSCKRDTPNMREGERTGAAGVAIAIHKKLAAHGSLKVTPLNAPAASGHCQKICLQSAGSDAVDIWAVYMPHDMAVRRQVYQVLKDNTAENSHFIMAGDWNAAYRAKDRCTGELQKPADEEHAQLLQALQMQPTDDGLEDNSRQHTFCAEGQQKQHSRIDDFTWSKTLQTGRKATTSVLKTVTGDSDHYPLIADIPLDNISFVPPGPELPQPDRTARIKWPATQKQLHDYKTQTELRVGQAARKAATEMREAIRVADETIGSQSPTERLRLNKQKQLRAAGLTKEVVLNHANKVSEMLKDVYDNVAHQVFDWTEPGPAKPTRYRNRQERRRWKDLHKYRAELKQALDTYNSKPNEAADSWHKEINVRVRDEQSQSCTEGGAEST